MPTSRLPSVAAGTTGPNGRTFSSVPGRHRQRAPNSGVRLETRLAAEHRNARRAGEGLFAPQKSNAARRYPVSRAPSQPVALHASPRCRRSAAGGLLPAQVGLISAHTVLPSG